MQYATSIFILQTEASIHLLWFIALVLLIHLKLRFIVSILNSDSVIIMNGFLASKSVYLLSSICFSWSFTLLRHLRYIINQVKTPSTRYISLLHTELSKKSSYFAKQTKKKAYVFHIHGESTINIFFYWLLGSIT